MPNPLEMLKRAGQWATTPLVDEETIAPMQEAMDHRSVDQSPMMARLGGFGAGALEGLRGQSSPLNIAGNAMTAMGAPGALRSLAQLVKGGGRTLGAAGGFGNLAQEAGYVGRQAPQMADDLSQVVPDLVEHAPVPQVNPAMGDVDALLGDMQRNLAKIPGRGAAPAIGQRANGPLASLRPPQTPPRMPAEFTPRGGEQVYNANVGGAANGGRMATDAYSQLMNRFGGNGRR